jgi:Protein of unknown function (DUF2924)
MRALRSRPRKLRPAFLNRVNKPKTQKRRALGHTGSHILNPINLLCGWEFSRAHRGQETDMCPPVANGDKHRIRLDYSRQGSGNGVSINKEAHVPDSVQKQLETLPKLSRADLTQLWQKLFLSIPDPRIRSPSMIRFLAYRIQERACGSLSATSERRLQQLAGAVAGNSSHKTPAARKIAPGTRLVREWQNQVHLVNVEAKGFEYRGARYQSLSEIARLITGTRWSGPLFFGTKKKSDTRMAKKIQ